MINGANRMKNSFPELPAETSDLFLKPWLSKGDFSLHELIENVIKHFDQPADITITSFSITENAVRSFLSLKDKGLIRSLRCVFDMNVKRHKLSLLFFGLNVVDEIFLTKNHSKIVLIKYPYQVPIIIIGSANLNINDKIEAGIITNYPDISIALSLQIEGIITESMKVDIDEFN